MILLATQDVDGLSQKQSLNISSPIKSTKSENEILSMASQESGAMSVELDDFFQFLDTKTVKKILDTSEESKSRIVKDIEQIEYDAEGARAILNSIV